MFDIKKALKLNGFDAENYPAKKANYPYNDIFCTDVSAETGEFMSEELKNFIVDMAKDADANRLCHFIQILSEEMYERGEQSVYEEQID